VPLRRASIDTRDLSYRSGGFKRLWLATLAIGTVLTVSSVGYWILGQLHHGGTLTPTLREPWSVLDCMYMTIVTVSTIGYTETLPLNPGQTLEVFSDIRVYTMAVILLAMVVVGFSVSSATAFLIEGDLIKFWQRRRAVKEASKLSNHYIVCGGGVTGEVILDELVETRHDVVVIEFDAPRAEAIRQKWKVPVLVGDAMSDDVLKAAGIERAAGVAAALPNDRDNVFLIISVRRYRKQGLRVVSLASTAEVSEKLVAAGADAVVAASFIGGMRLASELFRPAVTGFLDVMLRGRDDSVRFAQITLGPNWTGKTVGDLDLPGRWGLAALAVRHAGKEAFEFNPGADVALEEGAVVVTMGDASKVEAVQGEVA